MSEESINKCVYRFSRFKYFLLYDSMTTRTRYTRLADIDPNDNFVNVIVSLDESSVTSAGTAATVIVGDASGMAKLLLLERDLSFFDISKPLQAYAIKGAMILVLNGRIHLELSRYSQVSKVARHRVSINKALNVSAREYVLSDRNSPSYRGI